MAKKQNLPENSAQGVDPVERGKQYYEGNPGCLHDHVLVTNDGTVFLPSIAGTNAAVNHAMSIGQDVKSIVEVSRPEKE